MFIMKHRHAMTLSAVALCLGLFAVSPGIAHGWNEQTSAADVVQAQRISEFVAAQDWLGPISAVALSPFFGLACLSGIATYGPEWIRNTPLLAVSGPLNNPILFWSMAILTLMTSLPRWTKFSKPISMALEKVEAYSAIIILLAIRFAAGATEEPVGSEVAATMPAIAEAGILSLPLEILLSIALAINLIVVNTVKLVFDFLVWLTPVPAIDAVLELLSKLVTAGLIGLYSFSPTLATMINLGIFFICCLMFFTAKRAMVYFREIYIRPTIERVLGSSPSPTNERCVFFANRWNGYPRRTRARLRQAIDGKSITLIVSRWFSTQQFELQNAGAEPVVGILADTLVFNTNDGELTLAARKGTFAPLEPTRPIALPQEA